MRVLIAHPGPNFSVADVHTGLVKGLRQCGVEVASLNLDDRLEFYVSAEIRRGNIYKQAFEREAAIRLAGKSVLSDLYQFWPDVVIFVSAFFISPEIWTTLCRRPVHSVAWFTESPYEDSRQLHVAPYCDTVILNDPTNIQQFRAVNPRSWYFPHSYDPDIHRPGPVDPDFACDFSWVGTAFPSRIQFLEQVDWTGIDVKLGGNWEALDRRKKLARFLVHPAAECMDNTETVRLYNSSKLSANIYRKEAVEPGSEFGWAVGPREVELAATGTFMLREARGEGDELFPKAPIFTEPGEFGEQIRWWSTHDVERGEVARVNRDAIADRTFQRSAARLLELIDGAPKRIL